MTRKEAVMTINFLKEDYQQLLTEEDAEALEMAIEALQKPPISQRRMYQAGYRQGREDRPRGEWIESREQNILMAKRIEKGETWRVCSNCGTGFMIGAQLEEQKCYGERFHNFCPRCGADMRGGERSE